MNDNEIVVSTPSETPAVIDPAGMPSVAEPMAPPAVRPESAMPATRPEVMSDLPVCDAVSMVLDRKELAAALRVLAKVAPRKASIPILSHVLFADGKLVATDLDILVEIEVAGVRRLDFTLPLRDVKEIVSKSKAPRLEIQQTITGALFVQNVKLYGLDAKEFPQPRGLGRAAEEVYARCELPDLSGVAAATSSDATRFNTRFNLQGIFVQLCKDTATAIDGHRLHTMKLPKSTSEGDFLIPREAHDVLEVARKAYKIDTTPTRFHGFSAQTKRSEAVSFQVGPAVIWARLVDGEFPDWQQVLPKGESFLIRVESRPLAEALERVMVVATASSKGVRLKSTSAGLELSAENPDRGTARETIVATATCPVGFSIGVNGNYLRQAVEFIGRDCELAIGVQDDRNPLDLYAYGRPATTAQRRAVIMPMRL